VEHERETKVEGSQREEEVSCSIVLVIQNGMVYYISCVDIGFCSKLQSTVTATEFEDPDMFVLEAYGVEENAERVQRMVGSKREQEKRNRAGRY
jgi:hypothetical protein